MTTLPTRTVALCLAAVTAVALSIGLAAPASAIVPSDDSYATAGTIDSFTNFTHGSTTIGDSNESHENRSLGFGALYEIWDTSWSTWKAPQNGYIELDTLSDTTIDTTIAVFTGSKISSAKRLAWNDNASTGVVQSQIPSLAVKKGTTYHFQVGVASLITGGQAMADSRTGSYALHIQGSFAPPSNDERSNAKSESGTHWTSTGTTVGATIDPGEPTANPIDSSSPRFTSVWWKWKASADGTMTVSDLQIKPSGTATTNAYMSVFEQSPLGGSNQVSYGEGAPITLTAFPVRAGFTYYFQLGDTGSVSGAGTITLTFSATYTGPQISKLSITHSSHNGGAKLTITGTRFTGTSEVFFGNTAVNSFSSVSATKIVLHVPAHAKGEVPVQVYNGHESALTTSIHYTFT